MKYEATSHCYSLNVKKIENSKLFNVIFILEGIKPTDNVRNSFLHCLISKGNPDQWYSTLLEIPKVQNAIDEFIEKNSKFYKGNFFPKIVANINRNDTSSSSILKNNVWSY